MAIDLTALDSTTLTAQALSNIILVNPQKNMGIQPQIKGDLDTEQQAQGFLFHYEGENTTMLEADITDHYVEDNTAIQDQIALKPDMVVTNGYIGELNNVVPPALVPLKFLAEKLTVLEPYVPVISASALIAYNKAAQAYATAVAVSNAAVQAWSTITGGDTTPVQNKQQQAFLMFYGYFKNRQLFTVQTPWAVHKDMAIKSCRAVQDEETRMVTSFEVTFKQMRFAQTITADEFILQLQGRAIDQASNVVDHGVSRPAADIGLADQLSLVV